jgi:small basic protein
MSDGWTIDALIALGVVAAWAGCLGFLTGASTSKLIHRPIFLAGTTGTALVLAALVQDGATVRVGKMLLLVAMLLVTGIVLAKGLSRGARRRNLDPIVLRPMAPPARRR